MIKDEKYLRQLATVINQKALLNFALHIFTGFFFLNMIELVMYNNCFLGRICYDYFRSSDFISTLRQECKLSLNRLLRTRCQEMLHVH